MCPSFFYLLMANILAFLSCVNTVIAQASADPPASQVKRLEVLTVNLGGGGFTGALPFDVPFFIKGTPVTGLKKIKLVYKIKEAEAKTYHQWTGESSQEHDINSGDTEWGFLIGPLHPNVTYNFDFTLTRTLEVAPAEKDKFINDAYAIVESGFARPELVDDPARIQMNQQLNAALKALVPNGSTIVDAGGSLFIIDINEYPFKLMVTEMMKTTLTDIASKNDFRTFTNLLSGSDFAGFRARLLHMLNNIEQLVPNDKIVMNEPVDAGIEKYNAVKFRELAGLITPATNKLLETYEGKWTLRNNIWAPTTTPDLELMNLFYSLLFRMSFNFSYSDGSPAFEVADINFVNILLKVIPQIMSIHAENAKRAETRQKFLNKFPDVLADKLVRVSYKFSDQSVVDAVSQNTPYVGLDFGVSYIPGYSQLFLYEGVNFYLVPVNKDAPLKSFEKRYWFLKRFSIHFGLTQDVIKVENKRYLDLIDGVGSILLGGGLRINRIFRINSGALFFYERDNNPLKDKKHLTIMPQFSFTVDVNVARALRGMGTRLGIANR